ncbi:MAG: oxygenase MpaB family protein [Solirubrobacteraceae bacterium]|nr:MAG: DUF2236 domain-containing protein [Solirubrobacterales bacterium]
MTVDVAAPRSTRAPHTLGPDSLIWQRTGDWRLLLVGGRSLLLQVAHPAVAAGVATFSDYERDPWGRLKRTIDLYSGVLFDGPRSPETATRLRDLHKRVKGVDHHGNRYHALEPKAFHWVHATLVDGIVVMLERFCKPLRAAEKDRVYAEMCEVGQLYGVRERDMPPDWASFQRYFADFVRDELEDNDVVRNVLAHVASPPRHPKVPVPDALWRLGMRPGARVSRLATIGLLPKAYRERLGLAWTARHERELGLYGELVRRSFPLLPARVRLVPPAFAARQRMRAGARA